MKTGSTNEKFMNAGNFTFISLEKFGRVSFDLQNVGKNTMNKLASVSFCFMVGMSVINR